MRRGASGSRDLDVVLYGASGFVGRLTAAYLARHASVGLRIGLAGRSLDRLEAVRSELGDRAAQWPLLRADASNADSLAELSASTHVVATTVGPYLRHGLPLVGACARAGTDYADLAGEVVFVRRSIDEFHEVALGTGARIVHACGFDSVPSDLGVQLLHEQARADGAGDLLSTALVLVSVRGGISGGTIDSFRNQLDAVRSDPALRRLVADPYALSPHRASEPDRQPESKCSTHPGLGRGRRARGWRRDPELGVWTAPFVMAPYNTRIVRRSNAVSGFGYGRDFRYREVMGVGGGPLAPLRAAAAATALGAFAAGMAVRPMRSFLDRVLPSPGNGPDERTRRDGHFHADIHTRTSGGVRYLATVAGNGDPGYTATAVMLAESALCLALDGAVTPARAGVLTPATALGRALTERLRTAGLDLAVRRQDAGSLT